LGITQRTVRANRPANQGNQERSKLLALSANTVGDWLKAKRLEKNLTPGHVAVKMGIATSLFCSWESCIRMPDIYQIKLLATVLEFNAKDFELSAAHPLTAQ
jgi:DNA-binding transcriptional regulator YiaG